MAEIFEILFGIDIDSGLVVKCFHTFFYFSPPPQKTKDGRIFVFLFTTSLLFCCITYGHVARWNGQLSHSWKRPAHRPRWRWLSPFVEIIIIKLERKRLCYNTFSLSLSGHNLIVLHGPPQKNPPPPKKKNKI